jgi:hypothetical protein
MTAVYPAMLVSTGRNCEGDGISDRARADQEES